MIRPVTAGVPVSAVPPPAPYAGEIRVYPNPATRYIHIGLSPDTDRNSVVYKLYNTSGQMVYRGPGQEETLELSGFPPGIYFLNIEDGTMIRETRKIVITR
jgi:hypothetical protein